MATQDGDRGPDAQATGRLTGSHPAVLGRRSVLGLAAGGLGAMLLAACERGTPDGTVGSTATGSTAAGSTAAGSTAGSASLAGIDAFADSVTAARSGQVWRVESDGMPAHPMMVGITSWQQQVPVPQPYTGANAWSFPATPRLSDSPVSARTGLFRGAIAVASNGIPIFNALNNRGDDAYLAGELDRWGGHAGRADDYHYHVAPLHLQDQVGLEPIAYALDGFPMYGDAEPDGSAVRKLDQYNGHDLGDGYHYHGTTTYPYVNGGLRGVVTVTDQVEPQPVTTPFRPAGEPLRDAVITAFDEPGANRYHLEYTLDGGTASVGYVVAKDSVRFTFTDTAGAVTTQEYPRRSS